MKDAGTTAKVFFDLIGAMGSTGLRVTDEGHEVVLYVRLGITAKVFFGLTGAMGSTGEDIS